MIRFLSILIFIGGVYMSYLPLPLLATDEPRYELLEKRIDPRAKTSLDIQVSQRLTKLELAFAAREIRRTLCETKPKNTGCREIFPRIFIDWYLPGMRIGSGAWATTHFEPELTVKIMNWMLEFNPTTIN